MGKADSSGSNVQHQVASISGIRCKEHSHFNTTFFFLAQFQKLQGYDCHAELGIWFSEIAFLVFCN